MKISEILNHDDPKLMVDIIKSKYVEKSDKFYDNLSNITNNFTIQSYMLNDDIRRELLEDANILLNQLLHDFNQHDKWCNNMREIIKYLSST